MGHLEMQIYGLILEIKEGLYYYKVLRKHNLAISYHRIISGEIRVVLDSSR